MPRPKRHVSRCHSTPTEPPVEPEGPSNVATRSEPVPDPLRQDEPDFLDDANQCKEPNLCPSRRESNKYWTIDLKDKNGEIIKARKKVVLEWNELGQPIRESGGLLGQFLGHVASEFSNFPISYTKWSKIPASNKEHDKFDVSDESPQKYIIGSLGKKWRDNRSRLFTEFYDPALKQWAAFLQYGMEEKTQVISMTEKNIINRSKQKVPHTLGSMLIARKRDQIEELQVQFQLSSEDDTYTTIFGKEHLGRVRTAGQGVCPSQMFGSTSRVEESLLSNYILKAEYDANMKMMKKKVEENDAEIKLKSALAYIMQHMGGSLAFGFSNINQVEDLGSLGPTQTRGDFRHSSSNSHDPQRNDSSS
ncbi:hypothetical protein CDL12_23022 [Handroanthus impetiginosus]|uniref:Uncharacterized protein n=1 Tax=Handroanthus impetiginosus TaxID=429701 RepID=A0A2G9GGW7_9LAMI|nr:hypothetical protein CDL12_23022 [Handroanthus impetiginosus]